MEVESEEFLKTGRSSSSQDWGGGHLSPVVSLAGRGSDWGANCHCIIQALPVSCEFII